jgi:monoterpene epsilon-lactone hydrolase
MVMADRPEVATTGVVGTTRAVGTIATRLGLTIGTLPLRRPWRGPSNPLTNVAQESTREIIRSFLVGALHLPTPELRSVEKLLDDLCRIVLPPFRANDTTVEAGSVRDVPGLWVRPADRPRGTILYLHGGGYLATTPSMYTIVTAELVARTGCELFIADYRLAPEFPFPAGLEDAIHVFEGLLDHGVEPKRLIVAGDSGGGGLATSLFEDARAIHLPEPAGAVLLSPEVDLAMASGSVVENAAKDVLPADIPVRPYLGDDDATDPRVSVVYADLVRFPPTFLAYGSNEMFRDQIERFVSRLRDDDVDVTDLCAPNVFHVYEILMPWASVSKATFDAIDRFVDRVVPD